MRSALLGIVVASATLAAFLTLNAACGVLPSDCFETFTCPSGGGGSSGSSASASSSTSSGTGGGGGPPATCVPTAGMDPLDDTCGIFVSSSQGTDGAGSGSKAKPYKTLAAAITAAAKAKKPVYACAETFTETLVIAAGVGVYGGLECTKSWSYKGDAKSTLTADADSVPLTLSATANGAALFDFTVQAADAVIAGGSSIAVIADQVTAALTRCDLIAGNGKDGLAGVMSTVNVGEQVDSTASSIRGNNGTAACMNAASSPGGLPKDNTLCPAAMGGPLGGLGGSGGVVSGSNGDANPATMKTALGGIGQAAADPTLVCLTGNGNPALPGADGAGAIGSSTIGQLGAAGYSGVAGKDGVDGKPGQGGGGGGGAKGKAGCAGASGGGGGAGGCGGHGGTGGQAGGASIAMVSLGATLMLDTVTVALGAGGAGGDGGDSQPGAVGGIGGFGGAPNGGGTFQACDGGKGGPGGAGGTGGGGRGGHAIGIAWNGTNAPTKMMVPVSKPGMPGLGGKGGPSQNGDPGLMVVMQKF
ncbi:MAG: hypothetical protein ABJE95_06315 [Byssovorax sp.]